MGLSGVVADQEAPCDLRRRRRVKDCPPHAVALGHPAERGTCAPIKTEMLGPALRAAAVVRAVVRAVSPAERGDHSNGQLGRRRVEHLANETVIPSEQRHREREHPGECCGQRGDARDAGAVPACGEEPRDQCGHNLGNGASLRW